MVFFIFLVQLTGQDMSGEWNGILRQTDGGAATTYYFSVNLKQKGSEITGTSKVAIADKPEYYAIMELKGSFQKDILEFTEFKIIDSRAFIGLDWCLKRAKLNFTIKKDGFCIEGTWAGETLGKSVCPPGTLVLCKMVPIAMAN